MPVFRRHFLLLWATLPGTLFALEPGSSHGPLSLSGALDLALGQSPEIAAARHELKAWEGEVLQARLPGNPEFSVEVENLDAQGALAEENRVLTATLSQTLDFGSLSQVTVARREFEWAQLELEAQVRRVRARVRRDYVAVQAGQDRLGLSRELVALNQLAHGAVVERVVAGKAPPIDSLHSYMALAQARIDSGKSEGRLASARRALASACGLVEASLGLVEGGLGLEPSLPAWEEISRQVPASPEWRRIAFGSKVREAEVRSGKLARIPSVTLDAGVRRFPDQEGRSFVAAVSLPIPAWNWNQGAIQAAKSRLRKAEAEGRALRLDLMERLADLHGQAVAFHREALTLRDQVLPAAQAALEGAQEAFRVGKFGSLNALEAQRSLFEARVRYLEALESHHSALAELEELTRTGSPAAGSKPDDPDTRSSR